MEIDVHSYTLFLCTRCWKWKSTYILIHSSYVLAVESGSRRTLLYTLHMYSLLKVEVNVHSYTLFLCTRCWKWKSTYTLIHSSYVLAVESGSRRTLLYTLHMYSLLKVEVNVHSYTLFLCTRCWKWKSTYTRIHSSYVLAVESGSQRTLLYTLPMYSLLKVEVDVHSYTLFLCTRCWKWKSTYTLIHSSYVLAVESGSRRTLLYTLPMYSLLKVEVGVHSYTLFLCTRCWKWKSTYTLIHSSYVLAVESGSRRTLLYTLPMYSLLKVEVGVHSYTLFLCTRCWKWKSTYTLIHCSYVLSMNFYYKNLVYQNVQAEIGGKIKNIVRIPFNKAVTYVVIWEAYIKGIFATFIFANGWIQLKSAIFIFAIYRKVAFLFDSLTYHIPTKKETTRPEPHLIFYIRTKVDPFRNLIK